MDLTQEEITHISETNVVAENQSKLPIEFSLTFCVYKVPKLLHSVLMFFKTAIPQCKVEILYILRNEINLLVMESRGVT